MDNPKELHFVSQSHGVVPMLRQFSHNVVVDVIIKFNIVDEGPKLNKLWKVPQRERNFQVGFMNPCVVVKSLGNALIFQFGGLKDLWVTSLRALPCNKGASQKEVLRPLQMVMEVVEGEIPHECIDHFVMQKTLYLPLSVFCSCYPSSSLKAFSPSPHGGKESGLALTFSL
jgi:hypothetical protein